jgi:hypothetical protein
MEMLGIKKYFKQLALILSKYFFLLVCFNCNAQLFRFATFYTSLNTTAPFIERESFQVNNVENDGGNFPLVNNTRINKPNLNLTVGLRKIARFDYQVKQSRFYTGNENEVSDYAVISNAPGLEYLLEFNVGRNREMVFYQHEYRLRYISDKFTSRAAYVNNGVIDLKFTDTEIRYRKNFGRLDITVGAAHRTHPVYGYSPINEWLKTNTDLRQIAYMYGYWDFLLQIPFTENYLAIWYKNVPPHAYDNWSHYDDVPMSEFPQIQNIGTNQEFFREEFSKIVEMYNRDNILSLGMQHELSGVIGADYYINKDNFWLHTWISLLPVHIGLSEYSYEYPGTKLEWDTGFVLGSKLNKHMGLFVEGRHLKYWGVISYQYRAGINYIIF